MNYVDLSQNLSKDCECCIESGSNTLLRQMYYFTSVVLELINSGSDTLLNQMYYFTRVVLVLY